MEGSTLEIQVPAVSGETILCVVTFGSHFVRSYMAGIVGFCCNFAFHLAAVTVFVAVFCLLWICLIVGKSEEHWNNESVVWIWQGNPKTDFAFCGQDCDPVWILLPVFGTCRMQRFTGVGRQFLAAPKAVTAEPCSMLVFLSVQWYFSLRFFTLCTSAAPRLAAFLVHYVKYWRCWTPFTWDSNLREAKRWSVLSATRKQIRRSLVESLIISSELRQCRFCLSCCWSFLLQRLLLCQWFRPILLERIDLYMKIIQLSWNFTGSKCSRTNWILL